MKAIEIREHFVSLAPWVDESQTIDRIIIGDPQKEVRRVLVTWISSFRAVRYAVEHGFDMLMTHEPTFWVHANEAPQAGQRPIGVEKKRFIEASGLVILRNHDVWDAFPEVGIPWAWAKFLGFSTPPAAMGPGHYQHRYDIEPMRLDALARMVAARTASVGEPAVQLVGDRTQRVSKVGIGTGCYCRIEAYQDLGCDVGIVCDDGTRYWQDIQRAADEGFPILRVNHGTSEEPGMQTLAQYIEQHLPDLTAEYLPHGCSFQLVCGVD